MTYCEKTTNDNEIVLHCKPEEMAFILDLVNSIEHPIASKLRQVLQPIVRSHDRFQLLIERKFKACDKCKGEGVIMVGNLFENHNHDTEVCYRCDGARGRTEITSIRYEIIDRVPAEILEEE